MGMSPTLPDDERLARCLRALAHPARLAIVRALARDERCHCGQIVQGLTLAQSTVSQHLKVLKEAGLIAGTIEGPRSCYCLDRDAFAALAGAFGALSALVAGAPDTSALDSQGLDPLAPAASAPIFPTKNASGPVSA